MKTSTKVLIVIILALASLGGMYWLGKSGSGDIRIVVKERKIKIPIEPVRVDSMPAEIKWKVRTNTVIDSAEVKRLLAQNDSLLLELQRKGVEKIAVGDTLICKEDSIGRICDTTHIEYNESKKYFSYNIGFGARNAIVRDSLIFVPTPVRSRWSTGPGLHAGWGWQGDKSGIQGGISWQFHYSVYSW